MGCLRCHSQELRTILNRARQVAVSQNTTVCVVQGANKVQFLTGGCTGAVWTGPGTDGGGWFALQWLPFMPWYAGSGAGGVAYLAHVVGFCLGFACTALLPPPGQRAAART